MILLDTNVLSAVMQREVDRQVVGWLDRQPRSSIWTTAVTVLEIRYGLRLLAAGKRREMLARAFDVVLTETIEGRVAPFDDSAAIHAAELMAARRRRGQVQELRDTMIAGIALSTRATLATRNVAHFKELSVGVVDPWAN